MAKLYIIPALGADYPGRDEVQNLPTFIAVPVASAKLFTGLPALKPLFFLGAKRAQRCDPNHTISAAYSRGCKYSAILGHEDVKNLLRKGLRMVPAGDSGRAKAGQVIFLQLLQKGFKRRVGSPTPSSLKYCTA